MPEAARLTDPIEHTSALAGLTGGALLGAVIGAAVVFTGGAAAGALAAAATIGSGASLGSMIGEFVGSFLTFNTGAITAPGSSNVLTGRLPAARATREFAMCTGMPFLPATHPSSLIAHDGMPVVLGEDQFDGVFRRQGLGQSLLPLRLLVSAGRLKPRLLACLIGAQVGQFRFRQVAAAQ